MNGLCSQCLELVCECELPGEYWLEWYQGTTTEWSRYTADSSTNLLPLELHLPRATVQEAVELYYARKAVTKQLLAHRVVDADGKEITSWSKWSLEE